MWVQAAQLLFASADGEAGGDIAIGVRDGRSPHFGDVQQVGLAEPLSVVGAPQRERASAKAARRASASACSALRSLAC
ncbi:hypothetical protein GCM10009735_37850 [Actinomadura chokoriensis]